MKNFKDKVLVKELFRLEKEMSAEVAIINALNNALLRGERYKKVYDMEDKFNFIDIEITLSTHNSNYNSLKRKFRYVKSLISGKEESVNEDGVEYKKVVKQIDGKFGELAALIMNKEIVSTVDDGDGRRYMLENPSFTNKPVRIDNSQAIKQIDSYIDKPIILGDEILLAVDNIPLKLQLVNNDNDEYRFKNVRLKRC